MEILQINNLTFSYAGSSDKVTKDSLAAKALSNVNLSINVGDFTVVAGPTGCGKSTLLKLLKREIVPLGEISGDILYKGKSLSEQDEKEMVTKIGYVCQIPEGQIVTDKVWHELVFGLENLGLSKSEIGRRVAEVAIFFGIEAWMERKTNTLSGGEKQILNLASVMVMNPEILILDEPTSQLDPVATSRFIQTVEKINKDLGVTVLMVEHRLEEVLAIANSLVLMEGGRIKNSGDVQKVLSELLQDEDKSKYLLAMPASVRLYDNLGVNNDLIPLTVREFRNLVNNVVDITQISGLRNSVLTDDNLKKSAGNSDKSEEVSDSNQAFVKIKSVNFKYSKDGKQVLRDLNLEIMEGEILAIVGGNGSGKSTLLGCLSGMFKPYSGKLQIDGRKAREYKEKALLSQDVQELFLANTVRDELKDAGYDKLEADYKLSFDFEKLLDKHPYDLSGGEQELLGLAKVIASKPKLLLMDEPTKGVDAQIKQELARLMRELSARGITIVLVTHDLEFAANVADRVGMIFDGEIVCVDNSKDFFEKNNFYTTEVSRILRG